ncbi:YgiQ family radical SAM protein [uncultured Eubacterium sp.]|uniref:YgiQ family radical SAM protein n=2 Tax=Eubacterium TaxID=1730 RepID=UPI0015AEE73F|nr:YgiQ family radical SAM protein [uncultured Eubacterium sp.]
MKQFLPISRADMKAQGIKQLDFVYVIGDAYVDHPSFGHAIISRILQANGFTVGIISQPDWKNPDSISILGEPKLGFIVTGGNMDSMVNHYSVSKKRRQKDAFTPGGVMGKRPDYATVVYCNLIRRTYKHTPLIIGGLEASLRRLGHYDYWSNKIKRSILLDSGADLLLYGMGERSIVAMAEGLKSGISIKDLTYIDGTVYKTKDPDSVYDGIMLPSFEEICASKETYARSFYTQYCNTDPFTAKRLIEPYPNKCYVVQNPPSKPLTTSEMDAVYALPYMRTYHPSYEEAGGVPAIEEVKFSLVSNRGCYGGCSFCALTFHQGRIIQTRSHESIINEAKQIVWDPDFKGYIHDVGGPTANFRGPSCDKQLTRGVCKNRQCLFPTPCPNLKVDHSDYLSLLRELRTLPNVKKVFIRSGIRFDYLICDKDKTFFRELCEHHVSGQLKVAPEHISDSVLSLMGKPPVAVYNKFKDEYKKINERIGKKQYLVPYLMSSHPGSTLKEAVELAEYLRDLGYMPEQVQDFYPTPSTISTCMYYTGLDPRTMKKVYVTNNPHEKAMQRALIQYRNPKNYDLVYEALHRAHRTDLIGFGPKCLIRPKPNGHPGSDSGYRGQTNGRSNNSNRGKGSYKGQNNNPKDNSAKGNNRSQTGARPENGASTARPKKKKSIRNVHKKKQK